MHWDDYRVVDAAARARSLSGAAKMLGLSQPQLSRRLRHFEEQIGVRLFDRSPSGLKPTPAGERLIPMVADMRVAADAIERARGDVASHAMVTVRIAVDEVRERLLTRRLGLLTEALPGIELEIVSAQMHANHAVRETEIQLRSCLPESETLVARRLGHIAYAVFASHDYLSDRPAAATEERYRACTWIGFAPDRLWYPEQSRWLADRLARRPGLRVNTMTAMIEAVASGAGLALLPMFMASGDPRLAALTPALPELTSTEHLIVHRDLLREPAVRQAVDALVRLYREARADLLGERQEVWNGAAA